MRLPRITHRERYGGFLMLKKAFAAGFSLAIVVLLVAPAAALETEPPAAQGTGPATNYLGLALGLGLALAAFGGALGQGRAIAAAVDAVARQPEAGGRIQGMMIIGLALIETLVIYMLLICFMWGGKIV